MAEGGADTSCAEVVLLLMETLRSRFGADRTQMFGCRLSQTSKQPSVAMSLIDKKRR